MDICVKNITFEWQINQELSPKNAENLRIPYRFHRNTPVIIFTFYLSSNL